MFILWTCDSLFKKKEKTKQNKKTTLKHRSPNTIQLKMNRYTFRNIF